MSLQPLQPRYKPYAGAAAGWGALRSVAHFWLDSKQPFKNLRALLKTNQNGGFDCPGCAWGDSPEDGRVKFCENGAKAVNWEATKRRVDAAFFARYSVSALREQSDYWLEYQGRLTGPMRYDPLSDHYQPITWTPPSPWSPSTCDAWIAPTRRSSIPPGGPATRRPTSTSCSSARSAQTTSPTARTCATKPAAWHWVAASGSARAA